MDRRGAPNTFLRSALFGATQGRDRPYLKGQVIASFKSFTVKYTGERLTQSDLDVWESLIHIARVHPLDTRCAFAAHGLLKSMGRHTGKCQHDWLRASIHRLAACLVEVTYDRKRFFGALIESGINDERTNRYYLKLNPTVIQLFGSNDFTMLDWQQRIRMQKQPLAQWLHAFWSSHAVPKPIPVKDLHRLTGSTSKHLRNFKIHLRAALEVLTRIGFLEAFEIMGDDVRVVRVRRTALPWSAE